MTAPGARLAEAIVAERRRALGALLQRPLLSASGPDHHVTIEDLVAPSLVS